MCGGGRSAGEAGWERGEGAEVTGVGAGHMCADALAYLLWASWMSTCWFVVCRVVDLMVVLVVAEGCGEGEGAERAAA
jgi:hypothetical protein